VSETGQIVLAIVPLLISGVVAIVTNKQIQDLKSAASERSARIARLEQALIDHNIPLPADTSVDSRTDGLNMR
jgi:archaellum component FlaG (FlaF/FlaG flagellin family)